MSLQNRLLVIGLAAIVFTGCRKDDDDDSSGPTLFSKSYSVVTGSPTVSATSVTGTGTLSFGDGLVSERAEETNFLLTIDLSAGTDSFVALHSFSSSDLSGGQIVTLGRQSDGSFALQYIKGDGTSGLITSFNETVDATAAFTISVEVHNGEDNGSHVIAWIGDAYPSSPAEAEDGIYGAGKYTGLNFQNATITAFAVGAAEAEDE